MIPVPPIGPVGSITDVVTLLVVTIHLGVTVRSQISTLAAAVVALARQHQDVDDDRLQSDLDVDDRDVEAVETTIIACGGRDQGGSQ